MAKWIDDLGNNLAKQHPDKFKLTPERHWQVKSGNQWIILPDLCIRTYYGNYRRS